MFALISKNELERTILKLLLNSLYGKFGQRKKYETTYFKKIPFYIIQKLKQRGEYYELKMFSSEREDCYLITENKKLEKSYISIATIASYITSQARIKLLEGLINNSNKGIGYCDTDSIFLEKYENPNLAISNELGDWKLEDKEVIEVRGLKNYSYIENGLFYDAIKGVSKNSKKIGDYKFQVTKVVKTKEGLRRNIETGAPITKEKTISNKYDKRTIIKGGQTLPLIINEI